MNRRTLLGSAIIAPILIEALSIGIAEPAEAAARKAARLMMRTRPGDASWPASDGWKRFGNKVGGRLIKLQSQFTSCQTDPADKYCGETLKQLRNPFFVGDQPALTQTSGWIDAWVSQPAAYAVAAIDSADVAAAVNFARQHNLRLVVRGGGHSYQGTSDAPDSLMIWTRRMNTVVIHDAFVPQDCGNIQSPQPAVTLGAGAMWIDAYDAVTTRGGRYVQGGGCATVGVAGLVQSGGFNMFSKQYGIAAAGLLEAEIVTADGAIRVVNRRRDADLFWAIKGGGGGSFGVVTRVTLQTRELPQNFGLVACSIRAPSDEAYRALIAQAMTFYRDNLLNPNWGEKMNFRTDNVLNINMLFQGIDAEQAKAIWAPFFDWVGTQSYAMKEPLRILSFPARHFWDGEYMARQFPGALAADNRPEAPKHHFRFVDDDDEVGWFIHGYQSAWLPASLLGEQRLNALADALFDSTRHGHVQLFFSKGLAGAPQSEIDAARETAMNPDVLDAFALAIIAGAGRPAFPGMPGEPADPQTARLAAEKIDRSMRALTKVAPNAGCYLAESDYFKTGWAKAFWGRNYPRLLTVKDKYDPAGLFYVHHGVGSEAWNEGGFVRSGARPRAV